MLSIVGDVHGKYEEYYKLVKDKEASFQLGDFGFENAWNKLVYSDLDPTLHRVGQGNHDPHDSIINVPHFVGRFGNIRINSVEFFWIGGGLSIDMVYRVGEWMSKYRQGNFRTWYDNEQLSYFEMKECKELYLKEKPDIVISHEPPSEIINEISITHGRNILWSFGFHANYKSYTSEFLQDLFQEHQPDLWFFGHFHKSCALAIDKTTFRCLNELEVINI